MDTLDPIVRAMNLALAEDGDPPLTADALRPLIGMPVARQMEVLRGETGAKVDRLTDRYYAHFRRLVDEGAPLYPGVAETLGRLEGHPIATMTTRRREEAAHMLEVAGIADRFTVVVGGDDVPRPKPNPDLPLFAARSLGMPPTGCVVVGDAPVDILAGRAARMRTIGVTYGYGDPRSLADAKPHMTIDGFAELPAALEALRG